VILIEVNAFTSIAAGYDHRAILRLLHGWGYRCDLIGRKGRTRPVGEKGLGKFQNLVCRPVESTATIAFILPDLRGGGAEKSVCTLLNELCRREVRMEIDLVLVKAAGVFLKDVPGRVGVVDLGRERAVFALLPLVRYLRENRPRVLVAHLSHINLLAAMAIRLAGTNTRLVVVEHGILSPVRSFLRKEWWVQWGMKKCYPSAAAIVAVSKNAARDIALHLGLPEEKIRNIYNPVVTGELLRQAEMSLSHPWFGKKEAPVILGAGRLVKEKDFVTLIAAVAEVRKRRPVRLVILGEGEEREALESLVLRLGMQEVVWMPGFVDNPYAYMASSDVFVLSSRREGLGNVLIEAMACGCPVIATDCPGGPREILEDGAFGVLVPVGNIAALAGAILRVPEAPVGKERMAERAAFFSGKRAADAWLSLISELISPIEPVPGEKAVPGEKPVPGEKKVVLHVITGLRTGGAERMLCQLLSAIDRQRWEPVVVSLTDGGQPEAWLRERGIPVYNLGWRPGRLPSPGGCLQLIRLVRRIRPALIHGWMYHANLAAQLAGIFSWRGLPVIWSIHHSIGGLAVEKGGLAMEKKTTAGTIRLGAKLSRLPDKIVYASQVSRTQHISLGYSDRKGCLIPYGIDVDMFVARPGAKESVRKELGWPVGGLLIGSLARYHPMKDHENFLRAAALLCGRPEGREVQFMLAGAHVDPGNTELRVLVHELGIGDRVQLLGERADSARVLSAMDIFTVSSSHGEALPMVLLEAMSCGIPCVTTDVGDAGIAVGDTGRVVAPRDAEGLAEAWSELIVAGGAKRTALGEMARQRVLNHYTLTVCARAYEELYGSLRG
jgi:glycosyltransferase involved in cell wall biosynthesis